MPLRLRATPQHKYKAKPVVVDGVRFHSTREANRYLDLCLLEKAGEIRGLQLQPEFELRADLELQDISRERDPVKVGVYRGDFMFEERFAIPGLIKRWEWRRVVEDVKGIDTPLSRWKRKHTELQYGIRIRLV